MAKKSSIFIAVMVILGALMGIALNYPTLTHILESNIEITTVIPNQTCDNFSNCTPPYITPIEKNNAKYIEEPYIDIPFYFKLVDENGTAYIIAGEYNSLKEEYDYLQNHTSEKIKLKYETGTLVNGNETQKVNLVFETEMS